MQRRDADNESNREDICFSRAERRLGIRGRARRSDAVDEDRVRPWFRATHVGSHAAAKCVQVGY